ncbi:MAG: hypothetical protein KAR44_12670 [Candidatus Aegiribacteria sp.]|nr:hypothetical protein [Candidatus Aegiribacteria sp.]
MSRGGTAFRGLLVLGVTISLAAGAGAGAAVDEFFSGIESIVLIVNVTDSTQAQQGGSSGTEQTLERLKSLVVAAVARLDPGCRFDIINNASGQHACFGSLRTASQANKAEALTWVGGLSSAAAQNIFQAMAAESGIPPYDECMTFVIFIGDLSSIYWETDRPTSTDILSALPEGATLNFIKVVGTDNSSYEFCETLAEATGGRIILLD